MFALPRKYLKKSDDKYVFFAGMDVIITPVKCELTKLYFHTSELGFEQNLWFIIDSLDIATQHSRSCFHAGNKLVYQVLSANVYFHFEVTIRISLRNENTSPKVPTGNTDLMALFEVSSDKHK